MMKERSREGLNISAMIYSMDEVGLGSKLARQVEVSFLRTTLGYL